jgi:hypothetical protein
VSAHCTLSEYDDDGVGRCSCSLVTAMGGSCPFDSGTHVVTDVEAATP